MNRDFSAIEDQLFDLVVIGGGINGAAIAWDASLRGLKTLLLEKGDFGSGTSQGAFKTIHGGLRYLQQLNLKRLRESVVEQRILSQIAPHLVYPQSFLIPCYGYGKRGKETLSFALLLYELLSIGRNSGLSVTHRLPRHSFLSREKCLSRAPGLRQDGLRGGVLYYDSVMSSCDRLTLAVVEAAKDAGALAFNYSEVIGFERSENTSGVCHIDAVSVRDLESGQTYRVSSKFVVNAAGPWIGSLDRVLHESVDTRNQASAYLKGVQLVLPKIVDSCALGLESRHRDVDALVARGGRSYFFLPWRDRTLLGTYDAVHVGDPNDFSITREEVDSFLSEVNELYEISKHDRAPLNSSDVQYVFGGLRPIDPASAKLHKAGETLEVDSVSVSKEDVIVDYGEVSRSKDTSLGLSKQVVDNLVSVEGVKYTTFRLLAERVVDKVVKRGRFAALPCATAETEVCGGAVGDFARFRGDVFSRYDGEVSEKVLASLISHYGTEVHGVLALGDERPELLEVVHEGTGTLAAEIAYAGRHEQVVRLEDVVLRRTGLGTLGFPGEDVLQRAALILSNELGWDNEKREAEVQRCKELFLEL